MIRLEIIEIDTSSGFVLPEALMSVLHIEQGDVICITQTADGGFQQRASDDRVAD